MDPLRLVRLLLSIVSLALSAVSVSATQYDLVIANGRVIDPETNFDDIAHVGINGGSISVISAKPLQAKETIDASGLVVAPGFIDVHTHTPTLLGQQANLLDGITTQLDLEAGAFPVSFYGEHFKAGAQINYGSSVGHWAVRMKVIEGREMPYLFVGDKVLHMGGPTWMQPATEAQINQMRTLIGQGLDEGGLGIGVLLDYMTAAVSDAELLMLFDLAAERRVPLYVHVRRGYTGDPSGLIEVIDLAKKTGAALFICHITHSAMGRVGEWLDMIDQANKTGANITTETLSYPAGSTSISADVFRRRDWKAMFDVSYEDIQWLATGEWLTKETWDKFSKEQPMGMVANHYLREDWIETALRWPKMMVSTDALPAMHPSIDTNPNVAGTFSRVLGHYVRERNVLSLKEALAKLSLYQAQWLEQGAPLFKKKGRIQKGADADIVIFDAKTVAANAGYTDPYLKPTGIAHVLVAGTQVIKAGELVSEVQPGIKLLARR